MNIIPFASQVGGPTVESGIGVIIPRHCRARQTREDQGWGKNVWFSLHDWNEPSCEESSRKVYKVQAFHRDGQGSC
jgi:hypothetical protein